MKKKAAKKKAPAVTGGSPSQHDIPLGWRCPICHTIYSPSVDRCFCKKVEEQRDRTANEEYNQLVKEKFLREREIRERDQQPIFVQPLRPVVIHPWHPDYPFKPYC